MTTSTRVGQRVRITPQTALVLLAMLGGAEEAEVYGLELAERLRLFPGTVYGILGRLTKVGWLSRRPEPVPGPLDRPQRQLYRLTACGRSEARNHLAGHVSPLTAALASACGLDVGALATDGVDADADGAERHHGPDCAARLVGRRNALT